MGTTRCGIPVRAASALPSPVVEPPPTETSESAPSLPARASATSVTSTGVCAAAPSKTPAAASPSTAATRSARPRWPGVDSTSARRPPIRVSSSRHPGQRARAEDGPRRVGVVLEGVHGPSSGSWTDHGPGRRGTAAPVEPAPRVARVTLSPRVRLVLASALMLFVELALIRWTSSNNLYLVHLTNFVLLASFLGIGLGFLRGSRGRDLFPLAPALLALLVAFVLTFSVRTGTTGAGGWALVGNFGMGPLPRWLSLTVIFLLTVATLGTLAQEVARTFSLFEPLDAYRLDIGGSLLGIVTFAGLSFLRMPPLAWAALSAVVFVVLLGPRVRSWRWLPAAGIAVTVVVMLGLESFVGSYQWSPYYKIRTETGVRRQRAHRREQHPAADHRLGRADHQGLAVLPLPLHVRRAARRRARHRCGHRQRRRGRAEQGRRAGRRGRDRPGPGADRARPASGPALLRPPGDGARRRRARLHGAHRPRATTSCCSPCPTRRPSSPGSRRCAWRTTCSPPRR